MIVPPYFQEIALGAGFFYLIFDYRAAISYIVGYALANYNIFSRFLEIIQTAFRPKVEGTQANLQNNKPSSL